jgi:putative membrane protein
MMWFALNHGMGWVGLVCTVLFWVMVIGLIILVVCRARWNRCDMYHEHHGRPLGIAKERYAKGEISKEEFEQLKNDLS